MISLPEESWRQELADVPGIEAVTWDLRENPPREDIELVVPPYMSNRKWLASLEKVPALRAVQLVTAGYDHAVPYLPEGVELANGAGIHDTSTAELTLALILAAQRGIPDFVRAQQDGEWLRGVHPSLADRRVLLIGYGGIGRAIAARLLAFEARVTAVASRARAGDDLVEQVHGVDELPALTPDAEIVVLITPLTDATRHLVDADLLARLPEGALVVNMSRGPVVDTDALVEACTQGRVRAALDVTEPEPLPPEHPLWRAPGVLISPHTGGASTAFEPRAMAFLREQLGRYGRGEGLGHVVARG